MMTRIKHIAPFLLLILSITAFGQTYPIQDNGFKQCLVDNYPSVLDVNEDIDITIANNLTGQLYCAGHNIVNADGLQHFTSIDTINFNQNNLNSIDEIVAIPTLKALIIHDNELTSLPDLTNFEALTDLNAHNNFISTPPNLPTNSALIRLDLKQNNLMSFPDVSVQFNLENLQVSRNRSIQSIPDFTSLPNLKYLECYLCGLTEVPNLSNLAALEVLNIGYNHIKTLPDFNANTQLNIIYANDNELTSFSDMSMLSNLTKVRLYNNYLSFEDFEPLLVDVNYEEIYKIIPQNDFHNPIAAHYFEYDEIDLTIGISNEATGEIYSWHKDNALLWQGSLDTFNIDSAQIEDTGEYYFTVTHPSFPDLTLQSWKANTVVESCLDPNNFTIEITGASCEKSGLIKVSAGNQPQTGITYILKSQTSQREFESTDGVFPHLNNPQYTLLAKAGERCIKTVEENVLLPIEDCKEAYFTPNGDGIDDTFYFSQIGTAKIYNKWGQLIKVINIPTDWDGSTKNNSLIAPGYYTVDINDGEETIRLSVIY